MRSELAFTAGLITCQNRSLLNERACLFSRRNYRSFELYLSILPAKPCQNFDRLAQSRHAEQASLAHVCIVRIDRYGAVETSAFRRTETPPREFSIVVRSSITTQTHIVRIQHSAAAVHVNEFGRSVHSSKKALRGRTCSRRPCLYEPHDPAYSSDPDTPPRGLSSPSPRHVA